MANTRRTIEDGLPAALDLEQLVLGAILLNRDHFPLVRRLISAGDFSVEKHQRIFAAMEALHEAGSHVDRVTVADELGRRRQLADIGGLGYLVDLDSALPQFYNVEPYARIIQEKAHTRRIIFALQAQLDRCLLPDVNPSQVLRDMDAELTALRGEPTTTGSEFQWMDEFVANHEGGLESLLFPPESQGGIPFPLPSLTRIAGNMIGGDLVVVGARTSQGKSSFGAQIANFAARNHHRAVIFTLEMQKREYFVRMVCEKSGVDSTRLRDRHVKREEVQLLQSASYEVAGLQLGIHYSGDLSVSDVRMTCQRAKAQRGLDLVVIDYLQLMYVPDRDHNLAVKIGEVTKRLKSLAVEFNVPVVLLSQLGRGNDQEKRRPELRDLRDSGRIEEDASKVILLWRKPQEPGSNMMPLTEMIVAKNRNGPTGTAVVGFRPSTTSFVELDFHHDDEE